MWLPLGREEQVELRVSVVTLREGGTSGVEGECGYLLGREEQVELRVSVVTP